MYKKLTAGLLLFTFLLFSLAGCGNSKRADMSNTASSMPAAAAQGKEAPKNQSAEVQNGLPLNNSQTPDMGGHKVIQTGTLSIETLKFEETVSNLTNYITSVGGYIESSNIRGNRITNYETNSARNAQFVFRIPQGKFSQLFTDVKSFGTVVSEQSKGEDITDKYFDTEARVKSLKIQEDRLLSLLQKAGKMEDIIALEKELQSTRYQIENYTGTIRKWDSLVNYSSVTINIAEVQEIKAVAPNSKNGLLHRISFGFTNSIIHLWNFMQDLLVFVISALPYLVPMAAIFFPAYHFYRKRKGNIINKKEE